MNNYKFIKLFFFSIFFILTFIKNSLSEKVNKIEVNGNQRISNDIIIMFSDITSGDDIELNDLNIILKKIYESNFFEEVDIKFQNNILNINVKEFPIIQNLKIEGIKAKKIKERVFKNLTLKERSSFNKNIVKSDLKTINSNLQDLGYFFADTNVILTELNDNKVDLTYEVILGEKAKINKINFIGDKVFKDRKLRNVITSEESKFWKFISGKKYLNKNLISFDEKLLKNFYLNQGYYNVKINSSFAKLIDDNSFELNFNIDANKKFFFNDLKLNLPSDFNPDNFLDISKLFSDLRGEHYSINKIEDILDEIDKITLIEEYENIQANVDELIEDNFINLNFNIIKGEKLLVERINIFGNNVTRENVIRNQFEVDEGEYYNQILQSKTINNLKNLGFFKNVTSSVIDGSEKGTKIIDITVEEKPTGEIMAGAGVGTNGGSILFSVKENNYLGKGIKLINTVSLSEESIKGNFSVQNPNYKNTDKQVYLNIEALETDRLKNFGYKTNKNGFAIGTGFEIFDDTKLGFGTSNYIEKITTNSSASKLQKKQAGNYWDSFLNVNLDYDKRNQKFQTTDGFRSRYFLDLPIVSDTNTLSNTYTYKYFTELYEDNRSNFSIYIKSANSISSDEIKLSERIFLPSNKLRGFEKGKIGPKDGKDFIGGNYATSINFSSTLPQVFEDSQNIDFLFFIDAANVWGVDYDSSISDNSKIRSSVGIGIDWLTPIGPLNFTLAEPISKANSDITESFRFNLGTTF